MKILKYVVILFIILVFLGVAAIGGGYYYVTHTNQAALLSKLVKKFSGYELILDGEAEVALLPQPTLKANKVTVPAFSGDKPLFTAENVDIRIRVKGFSLDKIILENLTVESPTAYLYQPKKGLANWEDPYSRKSTASGNTFMLPIGQIMQVNIKNAMFTYINAKGGIEQKLTKADLSITGGNAQKTVLTSNGILNARPYTINGDFNLADLHAIGADVALTSKGISLEADGVLKNNLFNGAINARIPDINKLAQDFGQAPLFPHKRVNPLPLNLKANVVMKEDGALSFTNLTLNMNQTLVLAGNIHYRPPHHNKKPMIKGGVTVNNINLTQLGLCASQQAAGAGTSKPATTKGSPWNDKPLDVAALRNSDIDLNLNIKDIACDSLPLRSVTATIKNMNNKLVVEDTQLGFTENGKLTVNATVSHKSTLSGNVEILPNPLPVQVFLKGNMARKTNIPLKGNINLNFKGNTTRAMAQTLNGTINLKAEDGHIPGQSLANLSVDFAKFLGFLGSTNGNLDVFEANYTIENGVMRTDKLAIQTKDGVLNIKGDGKIDLPNWKINYRIDPAVDSSIASLKVPFKISGDLSNPSIVPEVVNKENIATGIGALIGGPAGAGIGKIVGKVLNAEPVSGGTQLNEQEREAVDRMIGDFFGKKSSSLPATLTVPTTP